MLSFNVVLCSLRTVIVGFGGVWWGLVGFGGVGGERERKVVVIGIVTKK